MNEPITPQDAMDDMDSPAKAELRKWEWGEPPKDAYIELCVAAGEVVINSIQEELDEFSCLVNFGNGVMHVEIGMLDGLIEYEARINVEEIAAQHIEGWLPPPPWRQDVDAEDVLTEIRTLRQFADALERRLKDGGYLSG